MNTILQNPDNSQNYNRYSYFLNNPLKYVDPSGYNYSCYIDGLKISYNTFRNYMNWMSSEQKELFEKFEYTRDPNNRSDFNFTIQNDDKTNTYYSKHNNRNGFWVEWDGKEKISDYELLSLGFKSNYNYTYARYTQFFEFDLFNWGGGSFNSDNKMIDNILGIGNNLNTGMGYLEGGIGAIQIAMLENRASLPLSIKIGTFSKFRSTYRLLGTTGRVLGRIATYVGAPLSTYMDYKDMQSGQISEGRFAYRTAGTASSIGGGALIGSAYGGPYGAIGGTVIGAGFVAGEFIYDGATYVWNETLWQIHSFENAINSGWYTGR